MWMNWWIGRSPYDGRPDRSPAGEARPGSNEDARASRSEKATPVGDLVAQTRGCSAETARRAVQGRPWKELISAWHATTKVLRSESSPSRLLALVVLRAAILDEMEAQQPEIFAAWLGEQRDPGRRRP